MRIKGASAKEQKEAYLAGSPLCGDCLSDDPCSNGLCVDCNEWDMVCEDAARERGDQ